MTHSYTTRRSYELLNVRLQELEDKANERIHEEVMAQSEVNKVEAAHPSIFVAGWRPFIGWGCGCAFIYSAILAPLFKLQPADIAFEIGRAHVLNSSH